MHTTEQRYEVNGRRFNSWGEATLFAAIHGGEVWRYEPWAPPENCGKVSEDAFTTRNRLAHWINQ